MENTTHLFLAIRFNCNKCHDHPFERWTQDQYYQTAAFFAQVGLKDGPGRRRRHDRRDGRRGGQAAVRDRRGPGLRARSRTTGPGRWPSRSSPSPAPSRRPRRHRRRIMLASWITSKDNPYFARSYVNRLWGYLFGVGIMEPIDDIRAGNPPTNPELLDYLTREFIEQRLRRPPRDAADLQVADVPALGRDEPAGTRTTRQNYSHAIARRLPAEVLYDTVYRVVGRGHEDPGRAAGDARGGAARLGRRAAQRVPVHLRPAGPRERLRVRALQRAAARPDHGADQRADDRRRHRRSRQRAGQARRAGGGRRDAGRRAVPPDPQPLRHPQGGRDERRRPPRDRGGPHAASSTAFAQRELEVARRPAQAGEGARGRDRLGEGRTVPI